MISFKYMREIPFTNHGVFMVLNNRLKEGHKYKLTFDP